MEHRVQDRKKKRVTCDLRCGDKSHRGIVLDLSPTGLFVQTSGLLETNADVEVGLSVDAVSDELVLQTMVARKIVVDRRLANVKPGGVGLRIVEAPSAYYELFGLERTDGEPDGAGDADGVITVGDSWDSFDDAGEDVELASFRVRVSLGPRSRAVTVHASTEDDARSRALETVGDGWEVLEVSSS